MSQIPPANDSPCIQLSATLSQNILSLSSSSPSSPPIYLDLHIQLTNSASPITVLLPYSALTPDGQWFYRSYYDLTSLSTGHHPQQKKILGILCPCVKIEHPETELLTLDPNAPATEVRIKIGVQPFPGYPERNHEVPDIRPYFAVAATQFTQLVAGEKYEVSLKKLGGEMPAYVWWWRRGSKEDVIQSLKDCNFNVTIYGMGSKEDERLKVEMREGPILEVVE